VYYKYQAKRVVAEEQEAAAELRGKFKGKIEILHNTLNMSPENIATELSISVAEASAAIEKL